MDIQNRNCVKHRDLVDYSLYFVFDNNIDDYTNVTDREREIFRSYDVFKFMSYHATKKQNTKLTKVSNQVKSLQTTKIFDDSTYTKVYDVLFPEVGQTVPYQAAIYGNVNTGEEHSMYLNPPSASKEDRTKLDQNSIVALTSIGKTIGGLIAMKALEENVISLDDDIAIYLGQDMVPKKYLDYDSSGFVQEYDLDVPITVRDLLQMKSGIPYIMFSFAGELPSVLLNLDIDTLRDVVFNVNTDLIPKDEKYQYVTEKYGHLLQFGDVQAQTEPDVYMKEQFPVLPLWDRPGESTRYGMSYDVLGCVVSKALQYKGYVMTTADYFKQKFLEPMELTHIWFPLSMTGPSGSEPHKLKPVLLDTQGSILENGQLRFSSEYAGDFQSLILDEFESNTDQQIQTEYAGFCSLMVGNFPTYLEFIKLILRKGVSTNGARILSPQTVEFFGGQSAADNQPFNMLPNLGEIGNELAFGGMKDVIWKNGCVSPNPDKKKPFKQNDTTCFWFGLFGSEVMWDTATGTYLLLGSFIVPEKNKFQRRNQYEILSNIWNLIA